MLKFSLFTSFVASLSEKKDKLGTYYSTISEKKSGTYVAVYPDALSISKIKRLCSDLKLVNSMESNKLHSTVMYSKKHVDHGVCSKIMKVPVCGVGNELALFPQQDGKKCLVLKLSSVDIDQLHDQLIKQGGTHDYPEYEAHITLARDLPSDFVIPNVKVDISLIFSRYEVKALDEDWK